MIVGIAGGSCSGKSTLAQSLVNLLSDRKTVHVPQDAYYKDRSDLPREEREVLNYDSPDALELDLLVHHLIDLKNGRAIEKPTYDFATHTMLKDRRLVHSGEIIIIEGTLIFVHAELRSLMDIRVFLDIPADIRLARRILRDTRHRGRSVESVVRQWCDSVRVMDEHYVAPTKRYADTVFTQDPSGDDMGFLAATIRGRL